MKKTVIVWMERPLTKKERRMFSKEHQGLRLSFRLRFPNAPKAIVAVGFVLAFFIRIWKLLL